MYKEDPPKQKKQVPKSILKVLFDNKALDFINVQRIINLDDVTSTLPKKVKDFFAQIADMGLKILITELDVIDKDLPRNVQVRDRIVAKAYSDYLKVALEEPAVIAVITWGLCDKYTWLSEFQSRISQ